MIVGRGGLVAACTCHDGDVETVRVRLVPVADGESALLDLVVATTGQGQPMIDRHCPRCGSTAHGRPVVRGAGTPVSLARSGGLCLVAVGETRPIGIDLETAGSVTARALAAAGIGRSPELDHTAAWVRAEAIGKARGTGLSPHPRPEVVTVADLDLGDGLVAAVAMSGPDPFRVSRETGTEAGPARGARA